MDLYPKAKEVIRRRLVQWFSLWRPKDRTRHSLGDQRPILKRQRVHERARYVWGRRAWAWAWAWAWANSHGLESEDATGGLPGPATDHWANGQQPESEQSSFISGLEKTLHSSASLGGTAV
ncbi:uncharacterized protein RCO7_05214 [Rhynchosporium graminicola]|uniref:Uncharacterized protein n=1 Tax=Rhynchosporium graminicola TaxID=2792576 RepID=A0A1E1L616_9HELO|nr:uncharacterized protein RCO7_05214 [Rhynchosporium commune]